MPLYITSSLTVVKASMATLVRSRMLEICSNDEMLCLRRELHCSTEPGAVIVIVMPSLHRDIAG